MNAIPPSFTPAAQGAAARWAALTEAASVVAGLAGAPADADADALGDDDVPELLTAAYGWRRTMAENSIADLAAIMEPGIAALLAVNARGGDPRAAAQALWREYRAAREAIVALLAPTAAGGSGEAG